jgi:hypothetical protein
MPDQQPAAWQRIAADTFVTRGPINLWGLILTDDAVGAADVTLYEGANTDGRRLFTLRTIQNQSNPCFFPVPILLEDGLYVDVGTNVLEAFILYQHVQE